VKIAVALAADVDIVAAAVVFKRDVQGLMNVAAQ
jgi:hypothetical protein